VRGEISKVAVIGAGTWGTTLANLLAEKGVEVTLWVREEEVFRQIKKERVNKTFLPGIPLVGNVTPVMSFREAISGKELVLLVVPSHVLRSVLEQAKPFLRPDISLMVATKGIENDSLMIMSEVVSSVLPMDYEPKFAYLGGPSFAKEVARKYPTAVSIACRDPSHGERLQKVFHTDYFRVYVIDDVIGAQLGGALKNVIAIAAGAADGLNFGNNARAALITRGLAEITRLGVAMGANPLSFAGLCGLGDLVLTSTGDLSRNRTVGLKIGKGMSLEEITGSMKMVAEGIKTAESVYQLAAKIGVDMPISTEVYRILYEGKKPMEAVKELMSRQPKGELDPRNSGFCGAGEKQKRGVQPATQVGTDGHITR